MYTRIRVHSYKPGSRRFSGFAFHSVQMERFQDDLVRSLRDLSPLPARVPVFSTLTGRRAEDGDYGARYWARGIRERVRFADAIAACAADGHGTFLEVGLPYIMRFLGRVQGGAASGNGKAKGKRVDFNDEDSSVTGSSASGGEGRKERGLSQADARRQLPEGQKR